MRFPLTSLGLAACLLVPSTNLLGQTQRPALQVPPGFQAQPYAEGLAAPTAMAFAADGWLYVAVRGSVLRLFDEDGDGRADSSEVVLHGLQRPNGLTWRAGHLWVTDAARLFRVRWPDATIRTLVKHLPGTPTPLRTILFAPSGGGVFVTQAPACRLCDGGREGSGGLERYLGNGEVADVWARGLGPSAGMAIHPQTGELWVTAWAGASLGDELPPDEINVVRPGRHYGWPWCYGGRMPYPDTGEPSRCASTEPPILMLPAGSFPLGLTFYTGDMYPSEYWGDALVALAGSGASRSTPRGYRLIRVQLEAGRPVAVVDFVTGWLAPGGRVWGRPVQPLVGPAGALYVSDDRGGRVWRITYEAPRDDVE